MDFSTFPVNKIQEKVITKTFHYPSTNLEMRTLQIKSKKLVISVLFAILVFANPRFSPLYINHINQNPHTPIRTLQFAIIPGHLLHYIWTFALCSWSICEHEKNLRKLSNLMMSKMWLSPIQQDMLTWWLRSGGFKAGEVT